jgi:DNA-binding MarR family transcriptional regulator
MLGRTVRGTAVGPDHIPVRLFRDSLSLLAIVTAPGQATPNSVPATPPPQDAFPIWLASSLSLQEGAAGGGGGFFWHSRCLRRVARAARGVGMHSVFFGVKRAHWRAVALTQPLLEDAGLTPARFDMLRIVSLHPGGITQSHLSYLLGVSAPTVSRMVKSIYLLGFVRRRRSENDRRCMLVTITHVGIDSMRRALAETIDSGVADEMAARGATGDRYAAPHTRHARRRVSQLQGILVRLRRVFLDPSPVRHPWQGPNAFPVTTLVGGRLSYDIRCAS